VCDIAGFRVKATTSREDCHLMLGEYTGELITQDEADCRWKSL